MRPARPRSCSRWCCDALSALYRRDLRRYGAEERFRRAVAAAAGLDHPHVVAVGRWGATATFLWYATRFVEGRRLAEMLRADGAMHLSDALRILEQVASALDYAHRRGAVHGHLTSANVIVEANDWALVSDFVVAGLVPSVGGAAQTLSSPEPTP